MRPLICGKLSLIILFTSGHVSTGGRRRGSCQVGACLLQIVMLICKISFICKSQIISHFTHSFFFFRETKEMTFYTFQFTAAENGTE